MSATCPHCAAPARWRGFWRLWNPGWEYRCPACGGESRLLRSPTMRVAPLLAILLLAVLSAVLTALPGMPDELWLRMIVCGLLVGVPGIALQSWIVTRFGRLLP